MITVATWITIFRILLVVPIIYLIRAQHLFAAGLMLGVAAVTDWLDGYIARAYNQQSRLGMLLDPVADKLLMVTTFTLLWVSYIDLIPTWFIIFIWVKEFFLAVGALLLFKKSYKPLAARFFGKIAMVCQIFYGLLLFFTRYTGIKMTLFLTSMLGVVTAVTLLALLDYGRAAYRIITKP